MSFPVFEAAQAFSDTTCRTLVALLIRSGGLAPAGRIPDDFVSAIRSLAAEDTNFAAWCRTNCARELNTSCEDNTRCAVDGYFVDWHLVAAELPRLIVGSFAIGNPQPSTPDQNYSLHQLVELSHLLVRQRTLETNFAAELQRQKMDAIYHFAYGLSHELNNPLANMATRAGVLARDEMKIERRQMLENIIANAMRGCEMLADLMLVARPPQLRIESIAFSDLLSDILLQAKPWAEQREVALRSCTAGVDKQTIAGDKSAIREALWAILRNAIEAMPDGGEVSLVACAEADFVKIRVIDQGCGLTPSALEHCFDPYFSGREAGRGLGLGLSKAKRIVDLHRGLINVYNRSGGGCEVTVCLPASAEDS